MSEPKEKILKVQFHMGQQLGNAVKNSVTRKEAALSWHPFGIKVKGVNANSKKPYCTICTRDTIHQIDVEDDGDTVIEGVEFRNKPGRPSVNKTLA